MRPDSFVLKPVSPFRLDLTVWALRRRPDNVVDRWTGERTETVWPYTTAKRSMKEMSQLMRSPRRETWPCCIRPICVNSVSACRRAAR